MGASGPTDFDYLLPIISEVRLDHHHRLSHIYYSGMATFCLYRETDLALVRDWFFPEHAIKNPFVFQQSTDMRQEAVHKVNVWTFKSHKIPHAILATSDLMDSLLHYEAMSKHQEIISYRAVQFMFAFAFMRFVNGFVDRDVAKSAAATLLLDETEMEEGRFAKSAGESSMYAYAASIGMPSRFVDLRHQVTHGGLPDIEILKEFAEDALSWLWEKWWRTNATGDPVKAQQEFEEMNYQRRKRNEPCEYEQENG